MPSEEPGFRDRLGPRGWDQNGTYEGAARNDSPFPSIGSAEHAHGTCRPCLWFHKPGGCRNSYECSHCHLCPASAVNKKRQSKGKGKEGKEGKDGKGERRRISETWEEPPREAESAADLGSRPRWSKGSEMHGMPKQRCRPCLFLWTSQGCPEGEECEYCHICVPEQKTVPPPPPGGPPLDRGQVPAAPSRLPPGGGMAIQLADRIQEPTPPPSTMVLGTAPPVSAVARRPPFPPRSSMANLRPPKRSENDSPMQMGLSDADLPCYNCGATLCICFPGGYGFSQRIVLVPGQVNGRATNGAVTSGIPTSPCDERGEDPPEPPRTCQPGSCTPCLEMMQSRVCSAGDSCQFCHQCVERRKSKKIANMSLNMSKKSACNVWM